MAAEASFDAISNCTSIECEQGFEGNNSVNSEEANLVQFQFYMYSVGGNIMAVLGLIGNLFSMVVLLDRRMRSSTSIYLFALAVSDSIMLSAMTLGFSLPMIYPYTQKFKSYYDFFPKMNPFLYPISLIAQTCGIYITVAFTVERYIAVCRPLQAADMCTVSRARKVVCAILIFAILYNIPRMMEYRLVTQTDSTTNTTHVTYERTEFGNNKTFKYIYFIYMHIPVMVILPFLILAVFNILLIRAVRQSEMTQGRISHKARRENNLTVMLIAVIVIFLLTQVVSIADNINGAMLKEEEQALPRNIKLTTCSTFMCILNSAINFYIYCVFGRKFRKVFCRIFCWSCGGNRLGNKETNTSMIEASSLRKASARHAHVEKTASGAIRISQNQTGATGTTNGFNYTPKVKYTRVDNYHDTYV